MNSKRVPTSWRIFVLTVLGILCVVTIPLCQSLDTPPTSAQPQAIDDETDLETLEASEMDRLTQMDSSTMDYITNSQDGDEDGEEVGDEDASSVPSVRSLSPTAYPALSLKDDDDDMAPAYVADTSSVSDEDAEEDVDAEEDEAPATSDASLSLDEEKSIMEAIAQSQSEAEEEQGEEEETDDSDTSTAAGTKPVTSSLEAANASTTKAPYTEGRYKFLFVVGAICTFIMIVGIVAVILFKYQNRKFNIAGLKNLIASSNNNGLKSILSDDFDPSQTVSSTTVEMNKLPKNYYEDLNACLTMDVKDNVSTSTTAMTPAAVTSPQADIAKPSETYKAPTIADL